MSSTTNESPPGPRKRAAEPVMPLEAEPRMAGPDGIKHIAIEDAEEELPVAALRPDETETPGGTAGEQPAIVEAAAVARGAGVTDTTEDAADSGEPAEAPEPVEAPEPIESPEPSSAAAADREEASAASARSPAIDDQPAPSGTETPVREHDSSVISDESSAAAQAPPATRGETSDAGQEAPATGDETLAAAQEPAATPEQGPTAAPEPPATTNEAPAAAPEPAASGEPPTAAPIPSRPTPASVLGRPPAPATSFGKVSAAGDVFLRLPDGSEHLVGTWATGNPQQGLEFYAMKYADLVSEIDLAAKRLADDRATPAQALATAAKVRDALTNPTFVGDLAALVARIGQLEVLVNVKKAAASEAKAAERERIGAQREALVAEAESLAGSEAWRVTTERFKVLVDEWKAIPRGDRASENAQWKRLSSARTAFDKRRRAHYAELETVRDQAKEVKEKLVKEAEALSQSRDWAKTTQAYRDLLDRWKKAGRAGKSDDALWEQFRAAQDAFFTSRNEQYSQRDTEETQALKIKEKLLDDAEKLVPVKDVRAAKKSLREIMDRWEKAGRVPRGDVKRLEARLRVVEEIVRTSEVPKAPANPELRGRALDTVTGFRESVTKLEKQLARAEAAGDAAAIRKAQQSVESAKALLSAAEKGLAKFGG